MFGRTLRSGNWSRVRGRWFAPPLSRASTAPATQYAPSTQFPDVMHPTRTSTTMVKGTEIEGRPVYLDNQATTPLDPRVLDAMLPFQTEQFGNPHSRTHMFGWETEDYVEHARAQIAKLINADPKEIIFTSGATESNNIAIKGIARYSKKNKQKNHVITLQTEHKCVLDSSRQLQLDEGFDATFLPVQTNGLVNLEVLKKAIRPDTALISVMMVNNEIGVQQPIKAIGEIAKEHGIPFHCDAAQAVGKIPVDVKELGIASASISGHKIYGPKGVGALYVRRRPRLRMQALFSGGGQERGLRSGTLPAPLCVGLGAACEIARECMEEDYAHVTELADRLQSGIRAELSHVQLNGDSPGRYPGNVNLSFSAVEGESLLMGMKEIAVSSGSACTSASLEPSYVLRALGVSDDMAHTSIRYGIGRFTTVEEIDFAIAQTVEHVSKLREMSPLWEMLQEGIDPNSIQWAAQ